MILYEFFDSDKLLIIKFDGDILENDFKEFIPFILSELDQHQIDFVLVDFRTAWIRFGINSLDRIKQYHLPFYDQFLKINSVYLVETPLITAFTILFGKFLQNDKIIAQTCSTIYKAIELLKLQISVIEMENRIQNLSIHFKMKNYE